jgi:hypothetical protein
MNNANKSIFKRDYSVLNILGLPVRIVLYMLLINLQANFLAVP